MDGQLLSEEEYKKSEEEHRPANISLMLGFDLEMEDEYTGRIAGINILSSSLSFHKMRDLTTARGEECGAPGDLVNWEETEWTLQSQAKVIEGDREWECVAFKMTVWQK